MEEGSKSQKQGEWGGVSAPLTLFVPTSRGAGEGDQQITENW